MRLDELFRIAASEPAQPQAYWLGSAFPLKRDKALRCDDLKFRMHPRHTLVEIVLDRMRPDGALSREEAVMLAEWQEDLPVMGIPTTYVYMAQPLGPTHRGHTGWWHRIAASLTSSTTKEKDAWARAYWAGEPCPDPGQGAWQALAKAVMRIR